MSKLQFLGEEREEKRRRKAPNQKMHTGEWKKENY